MDAQTRVEIRNNIAKNPNGHVHAQCVLDMLDHLDVLDDEVRLLRADLARAADDLRECWAQA